MPDNWKKMPQKKNIFHNWFSGGLFGGGKNTKYVSPDGTMEGIYDENGNLVENPEEMGTYNFASPDNAAKHKKLDVDPYFEFGNSEKDSTTKTERYFKLLDYPGAALYEADYRKRIKREIESWNDCRPVCANK